MSWSDLLALEKKLGDIWKLDNLRAFYCSVQTKDIADPSLLLQDSSLFEDVRRDPSYFPYYSEEDNVEYFKNTVINSRIGGIIHPFFLGNLNNAYALDTKTDRKIGLVLKNGWCKLSPGELSSQIIMDESGKQIYDFTKPEVLKEFVESHGYEYN